MKNHVVSLYDYTGEALRPWAEAGYDCYAYDIQHDPFIGTGEIYRMIEGIKYVRADLYDNNQLLEIVARHSNKAVFMSAFPPCTDLSSAGARWWKDKEKKDPHFQQTATDHVMECSLVGRSLDAPFYIENPVGALSRLWRKYDHSFHPCDYGGYLPEDDVHPEWPDYISPRDAYRKRTCLWTGCNFEMPKPIPVEHVTVTHVRKDPKKSPRDSLVHARTGGKSLKTKNIRSATPRGFAKAVFLANAPYSWGTKVVDGTTLSTKHYGINGVLYVEDNFTSALY